MTRRVSHSRPIPGHRGTTNLLCILWKDDVAASVEEMCTPDDDEDDAAAQEDARTDIDLGVLLTCLDSENTDYNCPGCKAKHGRNTLKFWRPGCPHPPAQAI